MHRSSSIAHALFFPVFIHQILLHLGLVEFPASDLVHIADLIDATFLRQRATHLRASYKCPRVEPSSVAPLLPSSTSDAMAEEPIDHAADTTDFPPPPTLDDLGIRCILETEMTIQVLMVRFWWTCLMSFVLCKQI